MELLYDDTMQKNKQGEFLYWQKRLSHILQTQNKYIHIMKVIWAQIRGVVMMFLE